MKHSITLLTILCVHLCCLTLYADEKVDFQRQIAPILEERCWYCHGEDEQESGLRLDLRAYMLRGGDSGLAAVVPGHPEKSYLVEVVNHVDEDMAMPPDDDKLPAEEIKLLERWIKEGATWPGQMNTKVEETVDHWSFLPLKESFDHDTIDGFLKEKLASVNLSFSSPADPRTLIRRASVVLTGLAPTPERVDAFAEAFAKDADVAYSELVEELLASPHFGERWAQHWLDVIRWAETNGSESNMYRKNAWMYRDYVVRSFNEDKPYDQFILEQLAGDTMGAGDATGFLVAGPHVPAGTVGFEPTAIRQARADRMDEILQTVGASMMGVTIGCARCHNHKFDPISITDYYSLSAVFQDIEFGGRFPELAVDHPRVVREKELLQELNELRGKMKKIGWGWIEDWQGYQEVRFPTKTTDGLRISFTNGWVMADELEIFEATEERRNLALAKHGTKLTENSATFQEGKPASKLTNGVFGTKQWLAKSPKGSKDRPWLEFKFGETVKVDTIRISTNRADFLETDYLQGMNKISYGDFKISLPEADGSWKPFSATASMKKRTAENEERQALQAKIQEVIDQMLIHGRQPAFLARFIEPAETFVLARGSPESPRDKVAPAAPKLLSGKLDINEDATGPQRRRALASWLSDPSNPLTARVMANRLWHHTFGSGIVPTPSDFGKAGASPTHPDLLDWLAREFVTPTDTEGKPFSMKRMIRMFVMSNAFRQSSRPNEEGLAKDATAQLLWRFPPRRVEAEVIRDSVLQASGSLDTSIGGPSYRIHNVKKRYSQWEVVDNHSQNTWRRMLYQERMRRVDDRIFTAFDFPDCGQIRPQRPVSTTPLQALNLMNSDFVMEQSNRIAQRATKKAGGDVSKSIDRSFQFLLGRLPNDKEREACLALAKREGLPFVCRALINTNEFAFLP
ncbi:MAG: DUF1553 domain-containing protein [Rubripirellula sp.]